MSIAVSYTHLQFRLIQAQIKRLMGQGGFYSKKFAGIDPDSIQSQEDFEKLPFTWKGDLRDAYPLGLQAVPDEQVVRIQMCIRDRQNCLNKNKIRGNSDESDRHCEKSG